MEREVQMYPSDNFEYHKANAAGEAYIAVGCRIIWSIWLAVQ